MYCPQLLLQRKSQILYNIQHSKHSTVTLAKQKIWNDQGKPANGPLFYLNKLCDICQLWIAFSMHNFVYISEITYGRHWLQITHIYSRQSARTTVCIFKRKKKPANFLPKNYIWKPSHVLDVRWQIKTKRRYFIKNINNIYLVWTAKIACRSVAWFLHFLGRIIFSYKNVPNILRK